MSNIDKDVSVVVVHANQKPAKPRESLRTVEEMYRKFPENEIMPLAKDTGYVELAERVVRDKDGLYAHPLFLFASKHDPAIGIETISKLTHLFLENRKEIYPMDILSISAGMDGDKISVIALVRVYKNKPSFRELYKFIGEEKPKTEMVDNRGPRLVIPEGAYHEITEREYREHERRLQEQKKIIAQSDADIPFLNRLDHYEPEKLSKIDDRLERVYDLRSADMQVRTKSSYGDFIRIFSEAMDYITKNEKDNYYSVLRDEVRRAGEPKERDVLELLNSADDADKSQKKKFFIMINSYVRSTFVDNKRLPLEDVPVLLKRIDKALFKFYVLQDLIDDALITDIKITNPWTIRVRIKGKAALSNITFIDEYDYKRFIQGIAVMNNIDLRIPKQTFSNDIDEHYKMRITLTSPSLNSNRFPSLHIRKLPKDKMMADELIKAGMMNEVIRDYICERGRKHSFMIVGPPGSGKSSLLNWIIEDAYESSAEILVIQDFDEIFAYRNGVMIEQVVSNPPKGEEPVTLEKLGEYALISGCNVFIIGETRGAEICHAIKLANSGCRTALTMHTQSASETIDNMIWRLHQGMPDISDEHAKRMLTCFDTIIYIDGFKIREIIEINGYDSNKNDMNYRPAYFDPEWNRTGIFAKEKDNSGLTDIQVPNELAGPLQKAIQSIYVDQGNGVIDKSKVNQFSEMLKSLVSNI